MKGLDCAHTRVIDEDVHSSERGRSPTPPSRTALMPVSDVSDSDDGAHTELLSPSSATDSASSRLERGVHNHVRAALGELQNGGASDVTAGAGHEGDFACEGLGFEMA